MPCRISLAVHTRSRQHSAAGHGSRLFGRSNLWRFKSFAVEIFAAQINAAEINAAEINAAELSLFYLLSMILTNLDVIRKI